MPEPLKVMRLGHLNHVTSNYDATRAHYETVLGAHWLSDLWAGNPLTRGFLMELGGEIIEVLIPKVADRAEGKQLARFGPHYASLELQVPDRAEARDAVLGRGIRLLLDGPSDFLTVAADTDGVLLQIYDGDWHADPSPPQLSESKRPPSWWRDEHPIGFLGMRHLTFATDDLEHSRDFWIELCGGHELYREPRAASAGEAIGIDIGVTVELLAPTGPGRVADFLTAYGKKIRSITYDVADIERTEAYFASMGVALVPGDLPGSLLLRAEDNRGAAVQFVGTS